MVQENLDRNAYAEAGQATEADIKLNALEQEITRIRQILGEAQSKDKLIKEARAIIEADASAARDSGTGTLPHRRADQGRARDRPGRRDLSRQGESKKVKHSINWRQYKKDDLAVKLAVSKRGAPWSRRPELTFEDHQFEFTYDLRHQQGRQLHGDDHARGWRQGGDQGHGEVTMGPGD